MTRLGSEQLDEWLSAYLDGELTEEEAQLVESTLREQESARRRLADLRRTVSLVTGLPRHAAPPVLADEVLARLERTELLGDVRHVPIAASPRRRRLPLWTSLAAAFGVSVLAGWWYYLAPQRSTPRTIDSASRVATGESAATASRENPSADSAEPESGPPAAPRSRRRLRETGSEVVARRDIDASKETATGGPSVSARSARTLSAETAAPSESRSASAPAAFAPSVPSESGDSSPPVDLTTKLASGFSAEKVRGHRYRDESVRLTVLVRDRGSLERVSSSLRSLLAETGASELAEAPLPGGGSESTESPARFFQLGREGSNYEEHDSRQLIARVRVADLQSLIGELPKQHVRDEDVHLSAGALVFRGSDRVRETIGSLAERSSSSTAPGMGVDGPSTPATRPAASTADQPAPAVDAPSRFTEAARSATDSPTQPTRRSAPDTWTDLLDTLVRTLSVSETDPGTAGEPHAGAADSANAPHVNDSNRLAFRDEGGESESADDGGTHPGLVARSVKALDLSSDAATANRSASVEAEVRVDSPIISRTESPEAVAPVAQDEPLVTLVIEVSVAPVAPPPSNRPGNAPPSNRPSNRPASRPPSN